MKQLEFLVFTLIFIFSCLFLPNMLDAVSAVSDATAIGLFIRQIPLIYIATILGGMGYCMVTDD